MNFLSSPFDALYNDVSAKYEKANLPKGTTSPIGIRSLFGRKMVVLDLEHRLDGTTKACKVYIYCKKYWTCEEWKIIAVAENDTFETASQNETIIPYEKRSELYKLINGETIVRNNNEQLCLKR